MNFDAYIISTVFKKSPLITEHRKERCNMKYILAIVLVVIMLLFAIVTLILAEYKEKIWDCIIFEEEDKNE